MTARKAIYRILAVLSAIACIAAIFSRDFWQGVILLAATGGFWRLSNGQPMFGSARAGNASEPDFTPGLDDPGDMNDGSDWND